jgi:hypothetical protein
MLEFSEQREGTGTIAFDSDSSSFDHLSVAGSPVKTFGNAVALT